MENKVLTRVFDFLNHMIHPADLKLSKVSDSKRCPVTGLDISMQPKHTKFMSTSGIKWYYRYEREIYHQFLGVRLSKRSISKGLNTQFRFIAHSIRNAESNPRNNTKRAIKKLLNDKNLLFNNLTLIDKAKLNQAGIK